jgi:hypothetical protein
MLINVRSLTGDATTVVVPDAGATGAHVRAALAALRGVKPRRLALVVKGGGGGRVGVLAPSPLGSLLSLSLSLPVSRSSGRAPRLPLSLTSGVAAPAAAASVASRSSVASTGSNAGSSASPVGRRGGERRGR